MNPVPLFFPLVAPAAEATEHVAKHLTPFEFILESNVINFLIVALSIFAMIKVINSLQRQKPAPDAVPPPPTREEVLLTEIRDLLARK